MKKCKYCISDIDEKAKICPNCRKKQTKSISGKTLLVLFIIFLKLLVYCFKIYYTFIVVKG